MSLTASTSAPQSNELHRVVNLRKGIKAVVSRAFKINILGINAILLAKQFGEQARGFGVISGELRGFSQALGEQMTGLNQNSVQLVDLATRQLKLQRQMQLLRSAGQAELTLMSRALQAQAKEYQTLTDNIQQALDRMRIWVDAAYQSCLFGTVIARSARIEAAHAEGASLTDVSNTFADHVQHILPSLELLRHSLGEQR